MEAINKQKVFDLLNQELSIQAKRLGLEHSKTIAGIQIEDLAIVSNVSPSGSLFNSVRIEIQKRISRINRVFRARREQILELCERIGVVIKEAEIKELVFQANYNDPQGFKAILEARIDLWRNLQKNFLNNFEGTKILGLKRLLEDSPNMVPTQEARTENQNFTKKKFKVLAVFEVEFFEGGEQKLVSSLQKRLRDARFKTMPEITVTPI